MTQTSHRRAVGGLASGLIAAVGLVLTVAAPADPPHLVLTGTDAVLGQSIHVTAELSETPNASGEISFEVFGPGDSTCSGPALAPAPASASVAGEGQYVSGEITPATAGSYYWSAHYSGDLENPPADSVCSAISSVGKASPDLTGDASAGVVGAVIHDEASVAGGFSPTGELTFSVYGPTDTGCTTPLATAAVPLQDAHATSADYLAQQAGGFRWTVAYGGDANNEAAILGCGAANQTSTVGKASPTLAGTATATASVGQSIGDSVTLSEGFSAGGQLVFRAYGPNDGTCAGTTTYEQTVPVSGNGTYSPAGFTPASTGSYKWTVEYAGDANNEAAALGCGIENQTSAVGKVSPVLAGTASSAARIGQSIGDSIALSEGFSATGQLVFRAYGPNDGTCASTATYEQTVPVSGNGTYSPAGFTPTLAGSYRWTVEYGGDANNEAAILGCGAANQTSTVGKASPSLAGTASSAAKVGESITDSVTLSEGFSAGGQLVFRAYGPNDGTCAGTTTYEQTVPVNGNGTYSPAGFAPPSAGLYKWTVEYSGDANNEAAALGCGIGDQASAVGTIAVTMTAGATSGTVGDPIGATATIAEGAIPKGQLTFKAFFPNDATCSGAVAFSSTVSVSGNGQYRSAAFVPSRVGAFRWTVAYSGDANHAATTASCGKATSSIAQAAPTIAGAVPQQLAVGTSFQDTATLRGGYSPTGTITFQIYGPVASGCPQPAFVDTVSIAGNGAFSSDPFVPQRPGRYSFVAIYSGDSSNKKAAEPCDSASEVVEVRKRTPKVKPRARLAGGRRISIRASLSGSFSPSGAINFRLYRPDDKHCRHKPVFSGGVAVKSNGNVSLAQYLATRSGVYRLSVAYSGDPRNRRYKAKCGDAQSIRVSS
jgi:hypothetical protein